MRDEHDDLFSVLLCPDALLGREPLLERLDGPPHLLRARPCLHEDQVSSVDHQMPVETPQAGDVGVNVVDQADGEDGVLKRGRRATKVSGVILFVSREIGPACLHRGKFPIGIFVTTADPVLHSPCWLSYFLPSETGLATLC